MRYIELRGWRDGHSHRDSTWHEETDTSIVTYLDIYTIDEICDGPALYERTEDGTIVRERDGGGKMQPVPAAGTTLKLLHASTYQWQVAQWIVYGTAADWVARIEAAILDDRRALQPAEDDGLKITDRDVWRPGEAYAVLDLVAHPDDVSRRLLAVTASQSIDKTILANRKIWCEVNR